jgi:RNA polymerase sigma-70 factor (ECF subfamily)
MWMRYTDTLRALARHKVPAHLRAKFDSEDLVQSTLIKVHQADAAFEDCSEPEALAYFRLTLASAVAQEVRGYDRGKRRVERERSLETALDRTGSRGASCLAADQTSPTARARRNEQLTHLADALNVLPESQRRAIELRYFQGLSVGDTAGRLGITYPAAVGLLRRGLEGLRGRLVESID